MAFGARVNGYRGNIRALTENCLRKAALWDEVKDDLKSQAWLYLAASSKGFALLGL